MVVVCNAGAYRAVLAYAGSIANGIRSVVALDDDLHRSSIRITINIGESVDETVQTAVVLRGSIGECAIRVDHNDAVLWIGMLGPDISAVIGQLIVERQAAADRSVLDGGGGVVIGHGDVVYAIDKGELSTIVCTSPAFYAEGICSCYWIAILIQIDLTKINGWG